jgi:mono/diheme cytochrome c family protein
MNRLAALSVVIGLASFVACDAPLYGTDNVHIMRRWSSVWTQECSSWLWSSSSGHKYCASPAFDARPEVVATVSGPKFDETKVDQASLMAAGETVYGNVCVVCHQADGKGQAGAFPPLAGSGAFYGTPENMARIIVHGLNGEIVVQGVTYNGAMPPQGALSDYEIAAVATYVRSSWGNNDGIVLPAVVKSVR